MICRLCLDNIAVENAVLLFCKSESELDDAEDKTQPQENRLVKMIANYLYLELSQDDAISTYICTDCCTHLENFHGFWQLIEQKQNTLSDKLLEINCDVNWADEEQDEAPLVSTIKEEDVEAQNVITTPTALKTYKKTKVQIVTDYNAMERDKPLAYYNADEEAMPIALVKHEREIKTETQQDSIDEVSVTNDPTQVKRPSKLQIHQKNEEIVANYMQLDCPVCTDSTKMQQFYRTFSDLREHFNIAHKTAPYVKCCDVIFTRLARLVEHVRWHQNPEEFTCHFCQKVMRSKINLQNHIKVAHNNENDSDLRSIIFPCTKCGQKFVSTKRLESHLLRHETRSAAGKSVPNVTVKEEEANSPASYDCETCGLHFNNRTTFECHILEHQTIFEPRMQCNICGEWLSNKGSLRRHQQRHNHSMDEILECQDCGKVCINAAALHNHVRYTHKKPKKFSCDYCDKSFKVKRYLEEHIATHTREKLHTCPHCPTEFRCSSNMYAHIKRKHPKEWRKARELKKDKQMQLAQRHAVAVAATICNNNNYTGAATVTPVTASTGSVV